MVANGVVVARRASCVKATGKRRAFTLLEVILALGLGFMLIVSIYVAASLHLRMADRAPAAAEYTHRIHHALETIADDLRHTLTMPPGQNSASLSSSAGSTEQTVAQTGDESLTDETASVTPVYPYGLWGDIDILVLYRIRRPTDIDLADALLGQGLQVPRPALFRVTYSLFEEVNESGETTFALYRTQVPAGFESVADELPLDPTAYPHHRRLLGDVVFLQFSYFDGASWLETWGDLDPTDPPVAVETVLAVRPPASLGRTASRLSPLAQAYGIPAGTDVFRIVVTIPGAVGTESTSTELSSELETF